MNESLGFNAKKLPLDAK